MKMLRVKLSDGRTFYYPASEEWGVKIVAAELVERDPIPATDELFDGKPVEEVLA